MGSPSRCIPSAEPEQSSRPGIYTNGSEAS
uniref:Uncharacterized protein n=1 Tax=Tetraselmis sp. GSL018 TaxID=582737 RepID=A0A061RPK3_9CHLO